MANHNVITHKIDHVATFGQVEELRNMFQKVVATTDTTPNSEIANPKRSVGALLSRVGCDILELTRATYELLLLEIVFRICYLLAFWISQFRRPLMVLQQIPSRVSLLLSDNIRFTDVLGDLHSLQFEQFRHWEVFQANLRHLFGGRPGEAKVRTGDFQLVSNFPVPKLLNQRNWASHVRPRSEIVMFVAMETLKVPEGHCPRCSTNGRSIGKALFVCSNSSCELRFSHASFRSHSSKVVRKKPKPALATISFSSPEERYRIRSWLDDVEAGLDTAGAYLNSLVTDLPEAARDGNQKAAEASRRENEELKAFRRVYMPPPKTDVQANQTNAVRSDKVHFPGSLSYDPLGINSRIAPTNRTGSTKSHLSFLARSRRIKSRRWSAHSDASVMSIESCNSQDFFRLTGIISAHSEDSAMSLPESVRTRETRRERFDALEEFVKQQQATYKFAEASLPRDQVGDESKRRAWFPEGRA